MPAASGVAETDAAVERRSEASWRALYPFASHWLELDGRRMHYLDEGDGDASQRTLLFVHGNPTWSFHWRRLILALRNGYRCVAPDHLGCGLSDLQPRPLRLADHIDNLLRLVDALDLQRITLVAQDWGGAIGLGALLRERQRFERIILFNTGAFRPWFIPWRIRVCRTPLLGPLAVQGSNAVFAGGAANDARPQAAARPRRRGRLSGAVRLVAAPRGRAAICAKTSRDRRGTRRGPRSGTSRTGCPS